MLITAKSFNHAGLDGLLMMEWVQRVAAYLGKLQLSEIRSLEAYGPWGTVVASRIDESNANCIVMGAERVV